MNYRDLVVLDVETSGRDVYENNIWELAFVPLDENKENLHIYIDLPINNRWNEWARDNFWQSKKKWEQDAMPIPTAARRIKEYVYSFDSKIKLVGQNIGFDYKFLEKLFRAHNRKGIPKNISHRTIDTNTIAESLIYKNKLPAECEGSSKLFKYFGIEVEGRHTALGDSKATKDIFVKLMELV